MLCERCGKNTATVMYTQIINGHKESLNICSECAAKESIFDNFGSLLSFAPREMSAASCPVCQMTISEFSRTGRMGCGECYNTFRTQAAAMLKKIHGTSKHIEASYEEHKQAPKEEKPKSKTDILREKLDEAIKLENFEEAAKLRDELRNLDKEGK